MSKAAPAVYKSHHFVIPREGVESLYGEYGCQSLITHSAVIPREGVESDLEPSQIDALEGRVIPREGVERIVEEENGTLKVTLT